VAHGEVSYVALLYDKIADLDKPDKGKTCLELLTKQVKFVENCGLKYKGKTIELERSIFAEVYKNEATELNLDVNIESFFTIATELV
jgi:hypothetical protein